MILWESKCLPDLHFTRHLKRKIRHACFLRSSFLMHLIPQLAGQFPSHLHSWKFLLTLNRNGPAFLSGMFFWATVMVSSVSAILVPVVPVFSSDNQTMILQLFSPVTSSVWAASKLTVTSMSITFRWPVTTSVSVTVSLVGTIWGVGGVGAVVECQMWMLRQWANYAETISWRWTVWWWITMQETVLWRWYMPVYQSSKGFILEVDVTYCRELIVWELHLNDIWWIVT